MLVRHLRSAYQAWSWRALRLALCTTALVLPAIGASSAPVQSVAVPSVKGQNFESAHRVLAHIKLRARKTSTKPSDQPVDTVLEQDPAAGTHVRPGSFIDLVLAVPQTQPEVFEPIVPNVMGMNEDAARLELKRAGFAAEVRAGARSRPVISQSPGAGARARAGSTVMLILEKEPPPQLVDVPNVVGMEEATGRRVLDQARLRVHVNGPPTEHPSRTITAQSPRAGERVVPGSVVTIELTPVPDRPRPITVPDVTGRTFEDATKILARSRLGASQSATRPSTEPAGTVIEQTPVAGTSVEPGQVIALTTAAPSPAVVESADTEPSSRTEPITEEIDWIPPAAGGLLLLVGGTYVVRNRWNKRKRLGTRMEVKPHVDAGRADVTSADSDVVRHELRLRPVRGELDPTIEISLLGLIQGDAHA